MANSILPRVNRFDPDPRVEAYPSLNRIPTTAGHSALASFDLAQKYGPGFSAARMKNYLDMQPKKPERMLVSEANELYGGLGLSWSEDDEKDNTINRALVEAIAEEKRNENQFYNIIRRAEGGMGLRFLAMAGGSMTDPLNLAVMFIPFMREARFVQLGAKYGVSRARFMRGFKEAGIGIAAIEPLTYGTAKYEQADWGLLDSMLSILGGATLGGTLRTGVGKVFGDWFGLTTFSQRVEAFKWATNELDKGRVVTSPSEILNKSISDLTDDSIDVKNTSIDEPKTKYIDPLEAKRQWTLEQAAQQIRDEILAGLNKNFHLEHKVLSSAQRQKVFDQAIANMKASKAFTDGERAALTAWQRNSRKFTEYGLGITKWADLSPARQKLYTDLLTAIEKFNLPVSTKLFRGTQVDPEDIIKAVALIAQGQRAVIRAEHAIQGFSFSRGLAKNMAQSTAKGGGLKGGNDNVLWHISMSKGTKGAFSGGGKQSLFTNEFEFLIGPNQTFFIEKVYRMTRPVGTGQERGGFNEADILLKGHKQVRESLKDLNLETVRWEVHGKLMPKETQISKTTNEQMVAAIKAAYGDKKGYSSSDAEAALAMREIVKQAPKELNSTEAKAQVEILEEALQDAISSGQLTKTQLQSIEAANETIAQSSNWIKALKMAAVCLNGKI